MRVSGTTSAFVHAVQDSPVYSRYLTPKAHHHGTLKPHTAPIFGKHFARNADSSVCLGCRNKQMPFCNGKDRICISNTKVCQRPTGPLLRDKLENLSNGGNSK
jgi:hypothetical protein